LKVSLYPQTAIDNTLLTNCHASSFDERGVKQYLTTVCLYG